MAVDEAAGRAARRETARPGAVAAGGYGVLAAALVAGWVLGPPNHARGHLLAAYAVQWLAFAAAVTAVRRVPAACAVPWILAGGAALQALAVLWPPRTTDDFYRYIWDGRVQAAGIDPYRWAPTDPHLAALRDGYLFPGGHPALNHPGVHTIYPPVAQAYFLLVHLVPAGAPTERARPLQLAAAALAVATAALLVRLLRRTGGDPRAVALWAWCPTVVLEAGNDAHVDALGAALLVAALTVLASHAGARGGPGRAGHPGLASHAGAAGRGRVLAAGALLGAAVGVKFLPALAAPALARHPRRWLLAAAAAGLLALAYLPHLLAVGPRVLGFLGGYLGEEGFDRAVRYPLLDAVLPDRLVPPGWLPVLAVLLLAGTAAVLARRADPDRPARAAAAMAGVAFCVVNPEYPWYALLLVALVAAADRPRWLPVAAAAWPAYLAGALQWDHTATRATGYGLAAAAAALLTVRERALRRAAPRT